MKIKNEKYSLSLIVLASLLFLSLVFYVAAQEKSNSSGNIFLDSDQDGLSDEEEKIYGTDPQNSDTDGDGYSDGAEVKTGYDPAKPAPGDKIATASEINLRKADNVESKDNLTQKVAQKISDLTSSPQDEEVTLEKINSLVDESLNSENDDIEEQLPKISQEDIKIKKQNYSHLSEEKAKEKKKEDFVEYMAAFYYILSSNSPEPITSFSDINKIMSSFTFDIIGSLNSRNSSSLDKLSQISEKSLEQLKEVEVPEELVDLHIKALRFALYAENLKSSIDSPEDDPLKDIVNLSKVQAFVGNLMDFSTEAEQKFEEYGVEYDETAKNVLKKYGVELEDDSENNTSEEN